MRSYRNYCRPPLEIERTNKRPGDLVLHSMGVERVGDRKAVRDSRRVAG